MIGTKLAHFTITAHLGSGGMGDVYQATDSKLGRSVAIKLLPEAFTHDTERATRFEREARVLASLNHPNIAAIYGIEQSGDRTFLVMEMVPGETLAERIKRGPIPVNEALDIAKQIAEALEAAHDSEKSIIHRDLKPANVKITPEGKVKVLDFGLAKAYEAQTPDMNLSQSPTISMAATQQGVILGTAAYMSPEQAKGRRVDRRTDIFAFGCVLYEMLTGRAAFDGDDAGEILARVIEREPDWRRLPAKTPAAIQRMLRRALKKDPRQRLGDIRDARIEIEESETEAEGPVVRVSARSARLRWIVAATLALVAAVLAIPTMRYLRETLPLPEMRVEINTPATTDPISFALSPDGRRLVFVASADGQSRLWLRPLDASIAQPLAGTEGAKHPFWSPDSASIGFFADGKLKRMDIGGGPPQTLATASINGGTWNSNGVILFQRDGNGSLFRVPASGGEPVKVTKQDKQTGHVYPQFLPGGHKFLFYAIGTPETGGIYLGSLDSQGTKRLTAADSNGLYAPQGWLLFMRSGTLMAQRLDLSQERVVGEPVSVGFPVRFANSVGAFSVSSEGLIAYRSGVASNRVQLTWFDRSGKVLGTIGAPDENSLSAPRLSPDGRRVAVNRTVQGNQDIWLLDSLRAIRFTFDPSSDRYAIWSPDGARIVFGSNRKGALNLYQKTSSGTGSEVLLLESPQNQNVQDWSPDGRFILFQIVDPQTGRDIWVLPLEGTRKPFVFLKTNFEERQGQFSRDGRWVAYVSNESGRYEVYVRPFPGPGGQWQISTAGGSQPRWQSDGRALYYIAPDGKMMAAPLTANGTTFEPGTPMALFQTQTVGGGTNLDVVFEYDVATDGRFLISVLLGDTTPSPITLLQNWKPPSK